MEALLEQLIAWARLVQALPLVRSAGLAMLIYTAFFLGVFLLERRAGVDVGRYRARNFYNDVAYTLFYKGGFYNVLMVAAVTNALQPQLPFLQLNLLHDLPWYAGLAVFWIGGDLAFYWLHRLQHANRFLWALHTVHHSQEHLNLFTAQRRHPIESLIGTVLIFNVGFHWVLGVPTQGWLPLAVAVTCVSTLQHAQLDWRFGPLHRIIASPAFHAFHHSTDPRHANANFAFLFSAWDYLFGTAVTEQRRPERYGIDGIDYRESLASQLVTPFRLMWRWRHAPPPSTEAAALAAPVEAAANSNAPVA